MKRDLLLKPLDRRFHRAMRDARYRTAARLLRVWISRRLADTRLLRTGV